MTSALRFATADDLADVWEIFRLGFGRPDQDREDWLSSLEPERVLLGLDDTGRPVAASHVRPFGQWFGGRRVAMGGYSPVAVLPEARGRGFGRAVTAGQYADLRERGEAISGLYPASVSLYRSVGFELAGSHVGRRLPAALLASIPPEPTVRIRRAGPDDVPAVRRCYQRVARGRDGYLDRPEAWWDRRLPPDLAGGKIVHVVDSGDGDDGELAGYATYVHRDGRGVWDYSVAVDEVIADDPAVLRALWRLVGSSGTQAPDVDVTGIAHDPIFLIVGDEPPEAVTAATTWMLRLIDAADAVAARGWGPSRRGRVDLAIADEHAPWNAGRWRLEVDGGEGRLVAGGDGTVELGIGALSALWAGGQPARALAAAGLVRTADASALAIVDDLFAAAPPTCLDHY